MKTQILFHSARGEEQLAITADDDDEPLQSLKDNGMRDAPQCSVDKLLREWIRLR